MTNANYVYDGQWSNNKKNGKGVLRYNGEVYEGDLKDDKRHGRGMCLR
jgi:hypothetical protein